MSFSTQLHRAGSATRLRRRRLLPAVPGAARRVRPPRPDDQGAAAEQWAFRD
jgi:hypothetical protein